jgi:isocitrate dehydrogenase kinase/phosphatase
VDLPTAAARAAEIVEQDFADFHASFLATTRRVRTLFERRDWAGVRRETVERMRLQSGYVGRSLNEVRGVIGQAGADPAARETWRALKAAYSRQVVGRDDVELAKTFYNSLTRKVFSHVGVDPAIDYQSDDIPLPYKGWEMAAARMYAVRRVDAALAERILADARLDAPFASLEDDARLAAAVIVRAIEERFGGEEIEAVDVLRPVFFRNKGAYLIGRVRRGGEVMPLVLALLHGEDGVVVDAVLSTEEEASVVFSFARWYFHVHVDGPREVIGFLQSILPRKRIAELYNSLGYIKHAKTELYRDFVGEVARAEEPFRVARGQRGLVMAVFTLPAFDWVFKVIRDRFPPQKSTTRWEVMKRYRQVLEQDRVGRMVDFQEFEHLPLPRERFSDELLDELLAAAGDTVRVDGDHVVLDHLYVERRVTPLDVFLQEADAAAAEAAVIDYGQCLRDLAAADVFPGDLLLKNFGVTRHGRVVFYDYDEFSPLVDLDFRRFPEATHPDQEMASEPWFSVEEDDVFPEEMRRFLGLEGRLREVFEEHHAELFEVDFWHRMQAANEGGELIDFFPYPEERRLRPEAEPVAAGA